MKRIICFLKGHRFGFARVGPRKFGFMFTSTCDRCELHTQSILGEVIYFRTPKQWLKKYKKIKR